MRIVFPSVVWDFVADEDDNTQVVDGFWDDRGMFSVFLSSFFADNFMVLRSAAIVYTHVDPSYTATFVSHE